MEPKLKPLDESHEISEVLVAQTPTEKDLVFQFRKQMAPPAKAEAPVPLRDEWDDSASILYIHTNGRVVATQRVNRLDKTRLAPQHRAHFGLDPFFKQFSPDALSVSSNLFVLPEWRNGRVLGKLLGFAHRLGRESEVQFDFTLCRPQLVQFYELIGYRQYRENVATAGGGVLVPMVCVMEDVDYFRRVGSVIYEYARKFPSRFESVQWFNAQMSSHAWGAAGDQADDEKWAVVGNQLDRGSMPIFKGLSQTETQQVLDAGTTLQFRPGETIIKEGYEGREMYVVLEGEVRAVGRQNGREVTLSSFSGGQVFGEIGFLMARRRTADVMGVAPGKLLELSQEFFHKLIERSPKIASKVLLNLCSVLCERLCATTVQLLIASTAQPPEAKPVAR